MTVDDPHLKVCEESLNKAAIIKSIKVISNFYLGAVKIVRAKVHPAAFLDTIVYFFKSVIKELTLFW